MGSTKRGCSTMASFTIYTKDDRGNMLIVATDLPRQQMAERIANNIAELYHDPNLWVEKD